MATTAAESIARQIFTKPQKAGDSWRGACIVHNGTGPNLAIWDRPDGSIGLHCHSRECSIEQIEAAILARGITLERVTTYRDGFAGRRDESGKAKRTWQSKGTAKGDAVRIVDDTKGATVVLTEGEKDADAVSSAQIDGFVGASYRGGSAVAGYADYRALRGRNVLVWPDHDEPGVKAAYAAAEAISVQSPANLALLDLAGATDSGTGAADLSPTAIEAHLRTGGVPYRVPESDPATWPESDPPAVRRDLFRRHFDAATSPQASTAWMRSRHGGAWEQRSDSDFDLIVQSNLLKSQSAIDAVRLVRGRAHVERYEDAATPWHLPYDWKRRAPIEGNVATFASGFVRESDPLTLVPYADRYSAPQRASFDPDFHAAAPTYVQFMADLWGCDENAYAATWADLVFRALFGDTRDHVTAYLVGQAGSGKSTIMDLLAGALGSSMAKRKAGTLAARFGSASLAGKRALWINEPEAREWHDIQDVLNALADGGQQAVEAKFEAAQESLINCHAFITANDLPTSWRGNAGQRRRRRVLRFEHVPASPDLNLPAKLRAELPAIVADWLRHEAASDGGVRLPSDHATVTAEADLQADPVRIWFAERAYIQAGADTKAGTIYGDFCQWFKRQAGGESKPMSGIAFGRVLSRLPGVAPAIPGRFRRRPNVAVRPTSE